MSERKEDAIRHKYDPLPEDGPRHKKKAKRKHVRSDHKHEYEDVCIDSHRQVYTREEGWTHVYDLGRRCRICGRLDDVTYRGLREPPEGMRLFEAENVLEIFLGTRVLPDETEVVR